VARIEQGNAYARSRKNRFRSSPSVVRMTSLILTVTSTIILGLQQLNVWTGIAFSLMAVVTSVNTLEPFCLAVALGFDGRSTVQVLQIARRPYLLHCGQPARSAE
jgi:hypothetical protein